MRGLGALKGSTPEWVLFNEDTYPLYEKKMMYSIGYTRRCWIGLLL